MQEPEKEGPSGLLVDFLRCGNHATITVCASAIILSLAGWSKIGLDPFLLDARAFAQEPWRLLSAHFVHANFLHLYFNLSCIWFLGREIERRLGAPALLGTTLFLMLGVSAAERAFDRGAIGLSGVVYGLWGFLFVGQKRCAALSGVLSKKANLLMVVWFFLCIVATWMNLAPISNWGHGAGALLGAGIGYGLRADGKLRPACYPVAALVLALLGCGASLWWPHWNFGGAADEFELQADAILERGDWKAAEVALRNAVRFDPGRGRAWWNLGVALEKQGREPEVLEPLYRAFECGGLEDGQKQALHDALLAQMNMRILHGDQQSALEFAQRAVAVDPQDRAAWLEVQRLADGLGDEPSRERASAALAKLGQKR